VQPEKCFINYLLHSGIYLPSGFGWDV